MLTDMNIWTEIRLAVSSGRMSMREAARTYNLNWRTIRKVMDHPEPPGYRRIRRRKRKIDPFLAILHQIIESDKQVHKKQRHTGKRIFERLRDEHGYDGGRTVVADEIRRYKLRQAEVFMPLHHAPGTAQFDFGDPYGNGQNLATLLGSVLRIDVNRKDPGIEYAIPEDNPFVDRDGARGEIWAYGVRNIWRMSFDRETGDLWAGDVGQNRYEEVDLLTKGGNYGWKIREGFHSFAPEAEQTGGPLIDPLAEYFHSEGLSITGGMVYRGERLPEYEGAYFYADYVSGKVWILRYDGQQVTENHQVASTNLGISAFGEDRDGNMYITAFDGKIYRFRPHRIDLDAVRKAFPKKLSQIRFVESLENLKLAPGMVSYHVNVPLWSDGAAKFRYFVLPEPSSVKFDRKMSWQFPVGTVLVKDFQLDLDRTEPGPLRKLETRFFVHSPEGWNGYTYVWNAQETEAYLLEGATTKTYRVKTERGEIDQEWYFPSSADCMACHTRATGFVLGPNTRQMNGPSPIESIEQLQLFSAMGVFTGELPGEADSLERYPDWRENQGSLEDRCRAYLDMNCSFCHQPGGNRRQGSRFALSHAAGESESGRTSPQPGAARPRGLPTHHPGRSGAERIALPNGRSRFPTNASAGDQPRGSQGARTAGNVDRRDAVERVNSHASFREKLSSVKDNRRPSPA